MDREGLFLKNVNFNNPPVDHALLKHLKPYTDRDELSASEYVKLMDLEGKPAFTINKQYGFIMQDTVLADQFTGEPVSPIVYRNA